MPESTTKQGGMLLLCHQGASLGENHGVQAGAHQYPTILCFFAQPGTWTRQSKYGGQGGYCRNSEAHAMPLNLSFTIPGDEIPRNFYIFSFFSIL